MGDNLGYTAIWEAPGVREPRERGGIPDFFAKLLSFLRCH